LLYLFGGSESAVNYWSSSENESNPNNAWNQNFDDGNQNNNDKNNTNRVRAVRDSEASRCAAPAEHRPGRVPYYRPSVDALVAGGGANPRGGGYPPGGGR
jgi:hypothetical protein